MNEKFSLNDFIEEAWSHADRDGEVTQEILNGLSSWRDSGSQRR